MTNAGERKPTSVILETVRGAQGFLAELGDKAIDIVTGSKVFEHVPVVSWGIKVLNVRDSFQQFRLKRNCAAFLLALGNNNHEDITRFESQLNGSSTIRQEFEDTTFAILLESEKPFKAMLYGKLLSCRIKGRLAQDDFEQLSLIVHAGSVPALQTIEAFFTANKGRPFTSVGHVPQEPLLLSLGIAMRYGNTFRISDAGQRLYEICFGGTVST